MRPVSLARLNNSWSCACILLVQVRRKGENENLAEWVVHITSEADCKGSNVFVTTYQKCGSSMPGNLPIACTVPAWARKTASIICGLSGMAPRYGGATQEKALCIVQVSQMAWRVIGIMCIVLCTGQG